MVSYLGRHESQGIHSSNAAKGTRCCSIAVQVLVRLSLAPIEPYKIELSCFGHEFQPSIEFALRSWRDETPHGRNAAFLQELAEHVVREGASADLAPDLQAAAGALRESWLDVGGPTALEATASGRTTRGVGVKDKRECFAIELQSSDEIRVLLRAVEPLQPFQGLSIQ